jgi:hypothetical protein
VRKAVRQLNIQSLQTSSNSFIRKQFNRLENRCTKYWIFNEHQISSQNSLQNFAAQISLLNQKIPQIQGSFEFPRPLNFPRTKISWFRRKGTSTYPRHNSSQNHKQSLYFRKLSELIQLLFGFTLVLKFINKKLKHYAKDNESLEGEAQKICHICSGLHSSLLARQFSLCAS